LDEQEDPMTDQQTQINNNINQASTATNNSTLPIKTTGNTTTTRSVIHKVLCSSFTLYLLVGCYGERQRGGDKLKNCSAAKKKFYELFK
jgi:hypothetical protein